MKITKGIRVRPKRIVLYGVESIGKSTFASQMPNPLVLDTEDGTNNIDVSRTDIENYLELEGALHQLCRDSLGYQTIVIDTIDKAERQMIDHMLRKDQKRSIEDYGFGKGYAMAGEAMGRFLAVCDTLIDRGLNVVLVGHSKVARTNPPDLDEGYDRYELKLTKQSGPLVKEWADCILFANYKTRLVEGDDGRTRARGGKERVLHTERTAAWDAKNRFGLPAELPMTAEALAPLFAGVEKSQPAKPGWLDRVRGAASLEELNGIEQEADQATTAGDLSEAQRNKLGAEISRRHDQLAAEEVPA
jgi:hypothetical protein